MFEFFLMAFKNWTVPMHALFSASSTVVISCSSKVISHMVFTAQVIDAKSFVVLSQIWQT